MHSLFSRIIAGEIPSYKIYEDEYTYAFLDIFPQVPGHTLIVPKCEVDHFADVPEPYYSAIFQTAKRLSPAIQKATECARVSAMFAGFEVPHCHYHLLPTNSLADIAIRKVEQAIPASLIDMQSKIISFL
jgi:histidine triad (HIT) family protein